MTSLLIKICFCLNSEHKSEVEDLMPTKGTLKVSSIELNSSSSVTPELSADRICIPVKMDAIAYRSHAQSSNSGYYQYGFQSKATNRSTALYSFTLKEGIDFGIRDEAKVMSQVILLIGVFV